MVTHTFSTLPAIVAHFICSFLLQFRALVPVSFDSLVLCLSLFVCSNVACLYVWLTQVKISLTDTGSALYRSTELHISCIHQRTSLLVCHYVDDEA